MFIDQGHYCKVKGQIKVTPAVGVLFSPVVYGRVGVQAGGGKKFVRAVSPKQ